MNQDLNRIKSYFSHALMVLSEQLLAWQNLKNISLQELWIDTELKFFAMMCLIPASRLPQPLLLRVNITQEEQKQMNRKEKFLLLLPKLENQDKELALTPKNQL